jgi:hypothetical protein
VEEGELVRLLRDGVGDLGPPVPRIHAVKRREGVEEAVAVPVLDVDAFAARHDPPRHVAARVLGGMRRGVEEVVAVPGREFVVDVGMKGHIRLSSRVFAMNSGTLA